LARRKQAAPYPDKSGLRSPEANSARADGGQLVFSLTLALSQWERGTTTAGQAVFAKATPDKTQDKEARPAFLPAEASMRSVRAS